MRIDLGAKVRTKDGQGAGHVKHAIWDPRRNEIIEYVVSTGGLLSHDAIVTSEMLESATRDGGEIVLDVTKKELDELARYESSDYTAPPTDWLAPAAYGSGGYLWPVTEKEVAPAEERRPSDELGRGLKIRRGMKVRDASGEVIGEVDVVRVEDQTGELRSLVVHHGDASFEVDAESIDRIDEDVRLVTAGGEIRGREKA
jgi:sporulation protein YlmC with PRC-barrel domain